LKPLLIFDLDGTLIDSGQTVLTILNVLRLDACLAPLSLSEVIPTLSQGGYDMVQKALCLESPQQVDLALREFRRRYHDYETPRQAVYEQAPETLKLLRAIGYDLCICTNKPRALADKVLKDTQIDYLFDFVVGGGDVPTQKPDPTHIFACLSRFSIAAENAIFIGDSRIDQLTSLRSGVPFIFFTEGYDDGVDRDAVASIFSHYRDLPNIISTFESQ